MSITPSIENMKQHAFERGGKCLSKEYWDDISRLMWMCAKGHVWESPWRVISRGSWCPACAKVEEREEKKNERREKWLEKIKIIVKDKGGKCLSNKYINKRTKMQFQCKEGHIWFTLPSAILRGNWCPKCGLKIAHEKSKIPLRFYQIYATERGGKLLSEKYINSYTKLLWECSKGHQWYCIGASIREYKTWCPFCASKKKNINIMQELAAKRGGKCLSEKYVDINTKLEWQCARGHVWKSAPGNIISKNWCPVCAKETIGENRKNDIGIYRKIAADRGGKLLSDKYINNTTKLLWECGKGHQWFATGSDVKNGKSWCPNCAGRNLTIKDMQEFAAKKGGKCLSFKFINTKTKLEWQCSKGHIWKAVPISIMRNIWCPVCGRESANEKMRGNIETYRKIAEERGGKLLSDSYVNKTTPLLWECGNGHQWNAIGGNVKNNKTWCPVCSQKLAGDARRGKIETFQKIAIERGGQLISDKYINQNTKLIWQCGNGHQWTASPADVGRGKTWCPLCAKEKKRKI